MASISSFHGGRPLNLWERSCLQSFADFGHALEVYSYDNKISVPPGVRVAEAAQIIPRAEYEAFMRRLPGAYPQFSDWFRYELLYQRGGWWMDTDVLCLSPTLPNADFFLARKKGERVNNAVMAFAAGHELIAAARDFSRAHLRKLRSVRRVYIGPDLISRLVKKHDLLHATADHSVCYPFSQQHVFDLIDPAKKDFVEAAVANSPVLHLFQESFREVDFPRDVLPPRGSFLAEKFVQHGAPANNYMESGTGRKYFEREIQRRFEVKNRPRGWFKQWHKIVEAITSIGRQTPAGRDGKH